MKNQLNFPALVLLLMLNACSTEIATPPLQPEEQDTVKASSLPSVVSSLQITQWSTLTGWAYDDLLPAWQAFLQSCVVLSKQSLWQETCAAADLKQQPDNATLRQFFEKFLVPYQVLNTDGSDNGLITGYFEPLLNGSRKPSERYRYPLYNAPDGLLKIDVGEAYPELQTLNLRGRMEDHKIVPYYTRAEIKDNPGLLKGHEFIWVDDKVDLFFLQIQGSGRIKLENGEVIKIGYAENNGHPYSSIGKLLVEYGELELEQASMQGIKDWGQQNPGKLSDLLKQNERYIFFRELPNNLSGPLGALGVPLTAGRSIAIDPNVIPQGAPVFLATTWPNSDKKLQRLMVAQDVGNAIKGNVRADFFWGFGLEAGDEAGKMKQQGNMWVLMPHDYEPPVQEVAEELGFNVD